MEYLRGTEFLHKVVAYPQGSVIVKPVEQPTSAGTLIPKPGGDRSGDTMDHTLLRGQAGRLLASPPPTPKA